MSLCGDSGCAGTELAGEESDGEGSTDAMGAFCGFRISRCGVRVKVCASFFSKDFIGCRRVGALFSMRCPRVPVPLVSWLTGLVSCWAEAGGSGWNSDSRAVAKPNMIT